MPSLSETIIGVGLSWLILNFAGCGAKSAPTSVPASATVLPASSPAPAAPAEESQPDIPSISLSNSGHGTVSSAAMPDESISTEEHRRQLLAAMMPLQVMLGQWHGTTQREIGQFKAVDAPSWVWDFQTDRQQPALVMKSAASPYMCEGRLTYLTEREIFQLKAIDADGKARVLEGTFAGPVEEFQGDDQQMHVKYKLELTQVEPVDQRDQWQIVFNQQENNRYLQEMSKKRGTGYLRFDTVATQREGTSFAKSDAGYGEKECIISGGLGTIQLNHAGKSYWVCCTGCKAAFEEDPVSWIAAYEKKKSRP